MPRGRSRSRCGPSGRSSRRRSAGRCPCPSRRCRSPPFSNILTAYSSMSPYGWNGRHGRHDDDVAGGCLQRADAPVELALLRASMTSAKSLTGVRQRGGRRLRRGGAGRQDDAATEGKRHKAEGRSDASTLPRLARPCQASPCVDVVPDALRGVDVAREERAGIGDGRVAGRGEREHVADERGRHADARLPPPARATSSDIGAASAAPRPSSGSRAMFVSSARSGARRRGDELPIAVSPWDSRKASRRWIRWLLACPSHARRMSSSGSSCLRTDRAADDGVSR